MIVNPGKFQPIIFDTRKVNHTNTTININQKEIKAVARSKLLAIEIDDKLNFNHYVNNICKSASNQLNAIIRFKTSIRIQDKKGASKYLCNVKFQLLLSSMELL